MAVLRKVLPAVAWGLIILVMAVPLLGPMLLAVVMSLVILAVFVSTIYDALSSRGKYTCSLCRSYHQTNRVGICAFFNKEVIGDRIACDYFVLDLERRRANAR